MNDHFTAKAGGSTSHNQTPELDLNTSREAPQQAEILPFFAKAAQLGAFRVKSGIRAGRSAENSDK